MANVALSNSLAKVSENITVYRYFNGYVVEVSGRDSSGDYKTLKIICNTFDEVVALLEEADSLELDN